MIEAVIFDLYGTLIRLDRDTSPYLRFARLVRPDDPRSVVLRSVLTDTRGLGDFAARLGVPPPSGVEALEADLERDLQSAEAFGDAAEALAGLRGRGLKLGLISNLAAPYKELSIGTVSPPTSTPPCSRATSGSASPSARSICGWRRSWASAPRAP
jgi:FMN phosphatase YigB (HAD superfamily)